MSRGQASVTAVEAALGVLLIASVTVAFGLGVPGSENQKAQAQLDTYASDTATLLAEESPRHGNQTRLAELLSSADSFERQRGALERRVERILPENVMVQVETVHGTVGQPFPSDVPTGEATVLTTNGSITLRVWYA
jgi:hypothetical protein